MKDSSPGQGIQVFDLTRLRSIKRGERTQADTNANPPRRLRRASRAATLAAAVAVTADFHYTEHGSSHNLVINEETGFLCAGHTTVVG